MKLKKKPHDQVYRDYLIFHYYRRTLLKKHPVVTLHHRINFETYCPSVPIDESYLLCDFSLN
jgi:hypothetical protein